MNWTNLTPDERAEYMRLQMSPTLGKRSALLPDGFAGCGACGSPAQGCGWCADCSRRYRELRDKLVGKAVCSGKSIADGNGQGADGVIYPGDPDHCQACEEAGRRGPA